MNPIPVVTVCNEDYLPGLIALHNSFLRHSSEGFEFCAIIDGEQEFEDHLNDRGIKTVRNPAFPSKVFPVSKVYPKPFPISYWRLLVPTLFPESRSIYIDTDALILQSLQPLVDLDMGDKPIAATRSNSPKHKEITPVPDIQRHDFGPMSSLYVFNRPAWIEKRILARCVEAMQRTDVVFETLSQALLQYVLGSDWHELPWQTQAHAGHDTYWSYRRSNILMMHFLGTNPWQEFKPGITETPRKRETRELWKTYA